MRILLRGEDSDGRLAVLEDAVPPRWEGPPLHRHGWDELFYVLAGTLTFQLNDQVFEREAGDSAFAPRDVPHTFANLGDEAAAYLVVCTPAGFERYFDPEPGGPLPPREAVGPPLSPPDGRDRPRT